MKVVIDIDDNIYTRLFDNGLPVDLTTAINDATDIATAIRNGTPLPEHHGRLIDADWVKNTLDIYVINEYNGQFIRRNDIDTIPTIIEGSNSECHIV